jgi:hypothetical protein
MSGSLLVFAAVFAGVGFYEPEARAACLGAAAACVAVALLGVPLVVRAFMSFTGDEEVLEHGRPETATITTIQPTGWRYNRQYPIVRFGLRMQTDGVTVTIKQAVRPDVLSQLAPGAIVNVRVAASDRHRVGIDWRELPSIPPSPAPLLQSTWPTSDAQTITKPAISSIDHRSMR